MKSNFSYYTYIPVHVLENFFWFDGMSEIFMHLDCKLFLLWHYDISVKRKQWKKSRFQEKYPSSEPQTYLLVSQEPSWYPASLIKPFWTTSVFLDHPILWVSAILQSASDNQDVNICCPCLHYSYLVS